MNKLTDRLHKIISEEKDIDRKWCQDVVKHYNSIGVNPKEVVIDNKLNKLFSEQALYMLKSRYLVQEDEGNPQKALRRAVCSLSTTVEQAQRLYNYVSGNTKSGTKWLSLATPIICNAGAKRGLPISCFLHSVEDSRRGILNHLNEISYLSTIGGGTGATWSNIRPVGSKTSNGSSSTGIVPFFKVADSSMLAWNQGGTRRGSCAVYLRVDHPEIMEFISLRKPTGGDVNRKCLNLHHAVILTDEFMELIDKCTKNKNQNDDFNLIDPKTKEVVEVVSARVLWQSLLTLRSQTGEPYFMFLESCNEGTSDDYKRLFKKLTTSNLCTEILQYVSPQRSAVCCLSSLNLLEFEHFSEDPMFFKDVVSMLDNAITVFIIEAMEGSPFTHNAIRGAFFERSIGVGAMGFHSLLQKNRIPFESALATSRLHTMFSVIKTKVDQASKEIGEELGKPMEAHTGRNALRLAIAPNASSSSFIGVSPCLEPNRANIYIHETYNTAHTIINPFLLDLLDEKGKNTNEVIKSISLNKGSVQHLDFLDDYEKDIFKTAFELDQRWIIEHASVAQNYIDQGISTNLFFDANATVEQVHHIHMLAWKKKLKTLYYYRSRSAVEYDNIATKITASTETLYDDSECLACEG